MKLIIRQKPSKHSNWREFYPANNDGETVGMQSIVRIMPVLKDVNNKEKLEAVMLIPNKFGLLLPNMDGGVDFIHTIRKSQEFDVYMGIMGTDLSSTAVMFQLQNSAFDEVSEPVRNTPSHPSTGEKNGNQKPLVHGQRIAYEPLICRVGT